jgi:hypothetical protein
MTGLSKKLARFREALRCLEVSLLLHALKRDGIRELAKVCQDMALEKANELSVYKVQEILDREGFAHCFACPERFGLRLVDGRRVCTKHLPMLRKVAV